MSKCDQGQMMNDRLSQIWDRLHWLYCSYRPITGDHKPILWYYDEV